MTEPQIISPDQWVVTGSDANHRRTWSVTVRASTADNAKRVAWSQRLTLTALQRLGRVLLAQVLSVTRGNAPRCSECARYNRRRGLNVPPTEIPFRMFHD